MVIPIQKHYYIHINFFFFVLLSTLPHVDMLLSDNLKSGIIRMDKIHIALAFCELLIFLFMKSK